GHPVAQGSAVERHLPIGVAPAPGRAVRGLLERAVEGRPVLGLPTRHLRSSPAHAPARRGPPHPGGQRLPGPRPPGHPAPGVGIQWLSAPIPVSMRFEASVISSTAASNAWVLARDGWRNPLILRTN